MREMNLCERKKPLFKCKVSNLGKLLVTLFILSGIFIAGCEENKIVQTADIDPLIAAGIEEILPANLADSVAIDPVISITFVAGTDASKITASTLTLKNSSASIPGIASVSGTTALFTFKNDLMPMTEYTATVTTTGKNSSGKEELYHYSWIFKTGNHRRNNTLSVVSVEPENHAADVPVTTNIKVIMNQELTFAVQGMIKLSLNKGYTSIRGSQSFAGNTVTFTPANNLDAATTYTAKVVLGYNHDGDDDDDDDDDDKSGNYFTWSFTTAGGVSDNSAPAVSAVTPANNATSVATTATVSANFSEAMDPATITPTTFNLKQGTTAVPGTVTYSANIATFTPTTALTAGVLYTATITSGVKDGAGNAMTANYSWSFTTSTATAPDVTAPTVLSVTPPQNATSIAVNSKVIALFSETMTSSTITTITFTLKQGTTSVAGTVAYSVANNTATFTPSASLAGNTVFTATVLSGVKDAAGNSMVSNYTWNFTTVTVSAGVSFATEIMPILALCNNCHMHPWTTSTVASTYYTNLVNGGYVNQTTPTSSRIYTKLNGGHPGGTSISAANINKILSWFTEGAKNN